MRVLVTGATGFFGAHVCAAFLDAGWDVLAARRKGSNLWRLESLARGSCQLHYVQLDVTNRENIQSVLTNNTVQVVINCAAYGVDYRQQNFSDCVSVNVSGAGQLIEAAADYGICKVIHVGTCFEYGVNLGLTDELTPLNPSGIYGATKAAGSIVALERAKALKVPLMIARPFAMYGPLESLNKFVPTLMNSLEEGRAVDLSPGNQKRDYLYVGDAAKALVIAVELEQFPIHEAINLCSGYPVSIRELGEMVAEICSVDSELLHWGAEPHRPDTAMEIIGNPGKAQGVLGWEATTSLKDGLRKTFQSLGH
jgi:nucleoside-diphosphate-sugar epimerase